MFAPPARQGDAGAIERRECIAAACVNRYLRFIIAQRGSPERRQWVGLGWDWVGRHQRSGQWPAGHV